jgi:hypothetical protein
MSLGCNTPKNLLISSYAAHQTNAVETIDRPSLLLRALSVLLLALNLSACGLLNSSDAIRSDERHSVEIETDNSHYRLEYKSGLFILRMDVEIINAGRRHVFLQRECGFGDEPSRHLKRTTASLVHFFRHFLPFLWLQVKGMKTMLSW